MKTRSTRVHREETKKGAAALLKLRDVVLYIGNVMEKGHNDVVSKLTLRLHYSRIINVASKQRSLAAEDREVYRVTVFLRT